MNKVDFLKVIAAVETEIQETFREKQEEYGVDDDVFQNIKCGARIARMSPERYVFTQMSKHIAKLSRSTETADYRPAMWDDPIRDCLVYLYLLRGLSTEWPEMQVPTPPMPSVTHVVSKLTQVLRDVKQPEVKVHQVEDPVFPNVKPGEVDFTAKGKHSTGEERCRRINSE